MKALVVTFILRNPVFRVAAGSETVDSSAILKENVGIIMRTVPCLCLLALWCVGLASAGLTTAGNVNLLEFAGRVYACVEDCPCPPGATGVSCALCDVGFFKEAHGSEGCRACPENSSSPEGSSSARECLCEPGNFRDGAGCIPCLPNTYKTAYGDAECTACPDGAHAPEATAGVEGCVCGAGYTANGAIACEKCAAGTFKVAPGAAACEECPANTHSAALKLADEAGCIPCQEHSSTSNETGRTERSSCQCDAGYYMLSDTCTLCTANFYCPGGNSIFACTAHAHGAAGLSVAAECVCDDGYYLGGTVCTLCPPNSFCTADAETACPHDSAAPGGSGSADACVCVGGFERV